MKSTGRNTMALAGCALVLITLVAISAFWRELRHWYRWGRPGPLIPTTEDILWWLPEDTQTVFVNQEPSILSDRPRDQLPPDLTAALEPFPLNLLVFEESDAYPTEIRGQKAVLCVEGSRRFRSPKGLGLMPYEGCQVFVFENDLGSVGDSLMRNLENRATTALQLGGRQVLVWEKKRAANNWKFYIARPMSNIILVATHQGYLEEVLGRIGERGKNRALPDSLPEWKTFDTSTSARFWAVRHYDPNDAQLDPSSPLRPKAPANRPDPQAIGFVFWYDPDSGGVANVRYLSQAKNAAMIFVSGWQYPSENLNPAVVEVQPGVVQISVDVTDARVTQIFLLVLLGYLGHGIYL